MSAAGCCCAIRDLFPGPFHIQSRRLFHTDIRFRIRFRIRSYLIDEPTSTTLGSLSRVRDLQLCSNEANNCGRASPSSRSATISSKEPVSKPLRYRRKKTEGAVITNDCEVYQIEQIECYFGILDRCGDYYRVFSQCTHLFLSLDSIR